jgi:hypothetical protein
MTVFSHENAPWNEGGSDGNSSAAYLFFRRRILPVLAAFVLA